MNNFKIEAFYVSFKYLDHKWMELMKLFQTTNMNNILNLNINVNWFQIMNVKNLLFYHKIAFINLQSPNIGYNKYTCFKEFDNWFQSVQGKPQFVYRIVFSPEIIINTRSFTCLSKLHAHFIHFKLFKLCFAASASAMWNYTYNIATLFNELSWEFLY